MISGQWSVLLLFGLSGVLAAHEAIPNGNNFPESTSCTSDLARDTCTTFTASSAEVPPEDFFTGMFQDLNVLLAAHDSTRLKHYSRPTSYSLTQALIEDAMDRLLPSLRIRTLISLLDLEALVAEDEDVNSTFRETVDFSAPNVKVQTAKIQSPQASKRERSIFSEGGTCNEICSYRSKISRCTTEDCLCDDGHVKELGKCTYCVTERIKSERFMTEVEAIFADILTLCEGYRKKQ